MCCDALIMLSSVNARIEASTRKKQTAAPAWRHAFLKASGCAQCYAAARCVLNVTQAAV